MHSMVITARDIDRKHRIGGITRRSIEHSVMPLSMRPKPWFRQGLRMPQPWSGSSSGSGHALSTEGRMFSGEAWGDSVSHRQKQRRQEHTARDSYQDNGAYTEVPEICDSG